MTAKTPTKGTQDVENNICYTPITLRASPVAGNQKNLTGLPRVARDICADLFNNIQKWNNYHILGGKLVKDIALLKSDSSEPFPDGLERLVEELSDAVQNLELYSNSLNFLSSQITALAKLQKIKEPLFISLTAERLSELTVEIAKAYKAELEAKRYVLENIAHSKNKSEAMFHAACWVHQQYVTNKTNFQLETLLTETSLRK